MQLKIFAYSQKKKIIILKELSENTQLADSSTSNDFNVIRKSIYRIRRKVLSLISTTITKAHVALKSKKTTEA